MARRVTRSGRSATDGRASIGILDALRARWRGTRWRQGEKRGVAIPVAGYSAGPAGPVSCGELADTLRRAAARADLEDRQLLVLADYFGFYGFPLDLASRSGGLVGAVGRSSQDALAASRSSVASLLARAVEEVEAALPPRPATGPVLMVPEPDPIDHAWVRRPECAGRELSDREFVRLVDAAGLAAVGLVSRAGSVDRIESAIRSWSARHGTAGASSSEAAPLVRFEHRRSAFAALSVALWEITHDVQLLGQCVEGGRLWVANWVGLESPPVRAGRVAVHPRWGASGLDLDAQELVLLAGEIFERRADDRTVALVLDVLRSGRHRELLSSSEANTVVWAVARGLAAERSWRSIELARWFALDQPTSEETVALVAWAAHVASHHKFDTHAWRLADLAEQLMSQLHTAGRTSEEQFAYQVYLVALVRSGCRVRDAERTLGCGRQVKVLELLSDAIRCLQRARQGWLDAGGSDQHLPAAVVFRQIEVLLLAFDMRRAGHPAPGITGELQRASGALEYLRCRIAQVDTDDADSTLLERQLASTEQAIADRLDDSPPQPVTDS